MTRFPVDRFGRTVIGKNPKENLAASGGAAQSASSIGTAAGGCGTKKKLEACPSSH
jgi:hypothetical protein